MFTAIGGALLEAMKRVSATFAEDAGIPPGYTSQSYKTQSQDDQSKSQTVTAQTRTTTQRRGRKNNQNKIPENYRKSPRKGNKKSKTINFTEKLKIRVEQSENCDPVNPEGDARRTRPSLSNLTEDPLLETELSIPDGSQYDADSDDEEFLVGVNKKLCQGARQRISPHVDLDVLEYFIEICEHESFLHSIFDWDTNALQELRAAEETIRDLAKDSAHKLRSINQDDNERYRRFMQHYCLSQKLRPSDALSISESTLEALQHICESPKIFNTLWEYWRQKCNRNGPLLRKFQKSESLEHWERVDVFKTEMDARYRGKEFATAHLCSLRSVYNRISKIHEILSAMEQTELTTFSKIEKLCESSFSAVPRKRGRPSKASTTIPLSKRAALR